MQNLTNPKWWAAAAVRAIKTVAQTALGTITGATVLGSVDWRLVASSAAVAGIASLLTSLAGLPEVPAQPNGTP